jgi:hypothetical protein
MINRSTNTHSRVPPSHNISPLRHYQNWLHDTKHEALLRSMPHINELKSFLATRDDFSWLPNSDSIEERPDNISPLRWSLQHFC